MYQPTRQHQNGGGPAGGAGELPELDPGVDGVLGQRLGGQAGEVQGAAGDEEAQHVLGLGRAALGVELDAGPADAFWEGHLEGGREGGRGKSKGNKLNIKTDTA